MGNKLPFSGLLLLLLTAVVGGVLVGIGLFLTSKFIYLIFVSPLAAAVLGSYILAQVVHYGRVRQRAVIILAGVLMGLIIYGTYRYAEYLDFRRVSREDILSFEPSATDEQISFVIDEFLKQETDSEGLVGFVKLQGQEGLSVTSRRGAASDSEGTNVGSTLTWVYWGLEILFLIGITPIAYALTKAEQPYCESENTWMRFQGVGYVNQNNMNPFLEHLKKGDSASAVQLIQQEHVSGDRLVVRVGYCSGEPKARLTVVLLSGSKSKDIIANASLTLEQYGHFTSI